MFQQHVCISSPVCSSRGDSAAPDRQAPSASGSVLLASVQVAHLHELLLADIIHHILHTHTQKGRRPKEEWGGETSAQDMGRVKLHKWKREKLQEKEVVWKKERWIKELQLQSCSKHGIPLMANRASGRKSLCASDSVLRRRGGGFVEVDGWKASTHTPCLPVPLHHAQNVNPFSQHFLTSLVWLHDRLP